MFRSENENRKYIIIKLRITSGDCLKLRDGVRIPGGFKTILPLPNPAILSGCFGGDGHSWA